MTDPGDIFGSAAELHDRHRLGDQLRGHRADDMHPEHLVGDRIGQNLDKAGGVAQRPRASIGQERKASGLVGAARRLELLLGLADPRDLGRRVDHPGDRVEIDVAMLAANALGNRDAFFLGLVREHGATHHIADRPDVWQVGLAVAVDHDEPPVIDRQPDGIGVKAAGVGHAADRDDQLVDDQLLLGTRGIGVRHRHLPGSGFDITELDAGVDIKPLLGEDFLSFPGHLGVNDRQEIGQCLKHGHFSAQPTPHTAHFEADDARTDHAKLPGHGGDAQRATI